MTLAIMPEVWFVQEKWFCGGNHLHLFSTSQSRDVRLLKKYSRQTKNKASSTVRTSKDMDETASKNENLHTNNPKKVQY